MRHLEHAEQKQIRILLMKQSILILQCLCAIQLNTVIFNPILQEVYGSLRDEIKTDVDLTVDGNHIPNNVLSFKYKSSLITNRIGVKIAVPLKYLSNAWRLLEMSLINYKDDFSFTWDPNCVLSDLVGASIFTIINGKLYLPIATLSTEDDVKLSKLLREGFRRPVYWNKYKIVPNKTYDEKDYIRELLDDSYQGVRRLFVLAYEGGANRITADSHRRYFLPRVKIDKQH